MKTLELLHDKVRNLSFDSLGIIESDAELLMKIAYLEGKKDSIEYALSQAKEWLLNESIKDTFNSELIKINAKLELLINNEL